jgi:hypothetical protein
LEAPAFSSTFSDDEKGVLPFVEGINARTCDFPFTVTVAYRWLESPFSYLTWTVVFVVALLEMPLNWRVPLLEPPIYPTDFPPEQPLQVMVTAPLDNVLEEDSASGVVCAGEGVQDCELDMTQLSSLVCGC